MIPKIKIEHAVKSFDVGGLEKIIESLMLHCGESFVPGVTVLQRGGRFSEKVAKKGYRVTLINASEKKIATVRLLWRLVAAFRTIRPDIIHCHDTDSWIYGAIAGRISGVKNIVFTKHGHLENINRILIAESRLASWLAKKIVAVSPQIRQELMAKLCLGPEKIDVVYNGIDTTVFHPPENKQEAKKQLGLSEKAFVVGSVTRFSQVKNIGMQIDMAERLKGKIPGFQYIIVAPMTAAGQEIQDEVIKKGLQAHVHFLGFRTDIPEILRAMDVFVLTSFSEGTSVALLEAMASGCIPVASSTGGTPNLIAHAKNGFLFEVDDLDSFCDYIVKCYNDTPLRINLSKNIEQSLENYTLNKMINRYENIYYNRTDMA